MDWSVRVWCVSVSREGSRLGVCDARDVPHGVVLIPVNSLLKSSKTEWREGYEKTAIIKPYFNPYYASYVRRVNP